MPQLALKETKTMQQPLSRLVFDHLPPYAAYVRDNYLVPYIQEQIRLSRALNLPMLKFFEGMPDDELIAMGIESHRDFLTHAETNKLQDLLNRSLQMWVDDKLGILKREEIAAEDITLASYIRKHALIKFLPQYTNDIYETINIIKDIDAYNIESDTAATNIYIALQRDKRNQLLEKLQTNDFLFKQAQARTHIGNWMWDIPENKVTWSDEMYRIYGLEPQSEEVNYETYISHIHPDDQETRKQQVQRVFETGEPEEHHYRIVTPAGNIKILHTKSEIQMDADGKPLRMMGTCQDVTEKQTLIDKLQHSERLYKQAQAMSHIGNWNWDFDSKKVEWSDEIYRIYELPLHSVKSTTELEQYNHPDDDQAVKDAIQAAIQNQQPFDFSYRIVLKDGRIKTLHAIGEVAPGKKGSFVIFGTLQDITREKEVERQLKDYRDFIQKITDVTPSIIAAYNIHTGKYSFVNEAVEKLLGYTTAEVMEKGLPFLSSLMHPDDVPVIMEKNTKALEEANAMGVNNAEPVVEFKYRMLHKDGSYRWVHTFGTIFERNEKGLVESVLNISVDITEQEHAEQALFKKNLQLQQSNTSLEEYAYVASHDLKEPLRKIATFSDRLLLTQQDTLTEEGKTFLAKIMDSSRRMQKMISDLLSVSTILGNKGFDETDLNVLLQEVVQSLDHKIEETNTTITWDDLPTLSVVPSQFRQLFQNLIGNSLKFTRGGVAPKIKITHSLLSSREVERYRLNKGTTYLQLQLSDNGLGFDNKYADKIFAIFQRLHDKTEYDGTGIGLAVCKKIVENHEGVIFASGVPNEGATFTIVVPYK